MSNQAEESKVRSKNAKEKQMDANLLHQARCAVSESAEEFLNEFIEGDGKVFFDTVVDFRNKTREYELEKEFLLFKKVGPYTCYDEKVNGEWRYRDV